MIGTIEFLNRSYQVTIWTNQRLSGYLAVDTETELITGPTHVPKLVTCQVYNGGNEVYYVPRQSLKRFFNIHSRSTFIAHNAAFDFTVLRPYIEDSILFDIYDEDRILDTSVLYRLLVLAIEGEIPFKYNLSLLSKIFLGKELDKNEEIRLNFARYIDTPIVDIPSNFLSYAAIDAIATFHVLQCMLPHVNNHDNFKTMLSQHIQVKGELALRSIERNGIGFDLEARDTWLIEQDKKLTVLSERLSNWGWVRGLKGNSKRFEEVLAFLGVKDMLPLTETGDVSTKAADLEPYSNHIFIKDYLEFMEIEKATSFVRDISSDRVHSRYTSILNTGRTSCSKPNVQQLPRVGGIRELFVADKGKVFLDIDYSSIELSTLAQVCYTDYGFSNLGDLINSGECPHYYTATKVYRKNKNRISKEERQFSKIPNFAFPTNMSPNTFIDYCRGYNVPMTLEQAIDLKNAYAEAYPEISERFWKVPRNETDSITLTGRVRANCTYTAYLNTKFQGLAADGLKLALYEIFKQGYTIVAEVHDQVIIEIENTEPEKHLAKIQNIMVQSMKKVVPDVRVSVEGKITKRWEK